MSNEILDDDKHRGTGRTTRLADSYIQQLYKDKIVTVTDHHNHNNAHRYLADLICKRIKNESNLGLALVRMDDRTIKLDYAKFDKL